MAPMARAAAWRILRGFPALAGLLLVAGCGAEPSRETPPPSPPPAPGSAGPSRRMAVGITGEDYRWQVRYPGSDGALGTPDDLVSSRDLHLPEYTRVSLELGSADYAYSLQLPRFDITEVAMPGTPWRVELETEGAGRSRLLGSQMCGFTHELLMGEVIVLSEADFEEWVAGQQSTP